MIGAGYGDNSRFLLESHGCRLGGIGIARDRGQREGSDLSTVRNHLASYSRIRGLVIIPKAEEVLDLLLSGTGRDVRDVNSRALRHGEYELNSGNIV